MEQRIFRLNDRQGLESSSYHALVTACADGTSYFWIDIAQPDAAALEELLTALAVHPLVTEGCLDLSATTSILPLPQCLYLKLPLQTTWQTQERTALAIICLPQALLTVHALPVPVLETMGADFMSARHFHASSIPAMLYQVLDLLFDEELAQVLTIQHEIDVLSDDIDENVDAVPVKDILTRKRLVARLTHTLEEQHRCVTALQTIESDRVDFDSLRAYFHDAMTHQEYALRLVTRQESRMTELHQHYLLMLQERTNTRLSILTILSAVFLPLTLLAGIYGMNFQHMPELSWRYGYPAILVTMLLVAGTMLGGLYVKGWFK